MLLEQDLQEIFQRLYWILAPDGRLLLEGDSPAWAVELMVSAGFSRQAIQRIPDGSILAAKREEMQTATSDNKSQAGTGRPHRRRFSLTSTRRYSYQPRRRRLDDQRQGFQRPKRHDDKKLQGIISLTDSASCLTWVTNGGLRGDRPEYATVRGAARSTSIQRVF